MRMHARDPNAWKYHVFCDGVELKDCLSASEEDGTATVYVRNQQGHLVRRDSGYDGHPILDTKVVRGRIEFRQGTAEERH